MKSVVALCLGGAATLHKDIEGALALGEFDLVVACNDAGAVWPGRLDAWVTLHPEKMREWSEQRAANGYEPAVAYFCQIGRHVPDGFQAVEYRFPRQADSGSSGMFAAKVALTDLGATRAVFCGIPMDRQPHFFSGGAWEAAVGHRNVWHQVRREYRDRIRSMSGWTAEFLGRPTREWVATGSSAGDVYPQPMEISMSKIVLDKIAYEPHPVSPERKRELNAKGFRIVDAVFAPPGAKALENNDTQEGIGTDSGDQFSDDQLRAAIETATGKKPHHKLGRDKLIEQFNALNAARQDEVASNGLTRREIEADLTAMGVEFDPADALDDLGALRDLSREERQ